MPRVISSLALLLEAGGMEMGFAAPMLRLS